MYLQVLPTHHGQCTARRLTARVREANKKVKRFQTALKHHQVELESEQRKREETERELRAANAQIGSFRASHPHWKPPADILLMSDNCVDGTHIFKVHML